MMLLESLCLAGKDAGISWLLLFGEVFRGNYVSWFEAATQRKQKMLTAEELSNFQSCSCLYMTVKYSKDN